MCSMAVPLAVLLLLSRRPFRQRLSLPSAEVSGGGVGAARGATSHLNGRALDLLKALEL